MREEEIFIDCMSSSDEVWRVCPIAPRYEVSSHGNVRRIKDGKEARYPIQNRKQRKDEKGYYNLNLRVDGKLRAFKVHTLIATAFICPKPSSEHQINHKNGIKTDNHVTNLEWVTNQENYEHAVRTGLITVKLTKTKATQIRTLKGKMTAKEIAKLFDISIWHVYEIWKGLYWN